MTRQERRAINRANAKLSTGPATPEGKAASSRNALKHGLTSMKAYVPHEEQAYLAEMDRYLNLYDPQSDDEQDLVETLVDVTWRLLRIPALEAKLFADPDADPHKIIRAIDTLSRHETRLRKLAKTTCDSLVAMQTAREHLVRKGELPPDEMRNCQSRNHLPATPGSVGFVLQSHQSAGPNSDASLADCLSSTSQIPSSSTSVAA